MFEVRKLPTKCDTCSCFLYCKKNNIIIENDFTSEIVKQSGNGDILFIIDHHRKNKDLYKFSNFLEKQNINNYMIVASLNCIFDYTNNPSILADCNLHNYCKKIDIAKYNPKVIITVGSGIYQIANTGDITSWQYFNEYQFNQTYFYTSYEFNVKNNKKIRVYPLPYFYDMIENYDFEYNYAKIQLEKVKNYLIDFEDEKPFNDFAIWRVDNSNEFLKSKIGRGKVAWDTETSSLDVLQADDYDVGCVSLSFDGNTGYYLPFEDIDKNILSDFFKNKYQITANGKFDLLALGNKDIENCKVHEDVTLLFHLLNTERKTNSIKVLAWLIGFGGYDEVFDNYKKANKITNYLKVPEQILIPYAVLDSIVTYRLYELGIELAKIQPIVLEAYRNYIIPVIPAFVDIEKNGMAINFEELDKIHADLIYRIKTLEDDIKKLLRKDINISSNQQLATVLDALGFKDHGRGKEGYLSVGTNSITEWKKSKNKKHALIAQKLEERSSLVKLDNTFVGDSTYNDKVDDFLLIRGEDENSKVEGLTKFIYSDGKIHPQYSPGRASSLRSISWNPNGQNFPKHGDDAKLFRKIFKCPDDFYFLDADYAGFQMRIAGIYSQDEVMKDIFVNKGGDIHSLMGNKIFCPEMSLEDFMQKVDRKEEPYKTQRFKAKNQFNFPLLFSRTAYVIYGSIKDAWSEEDMDDYILKNNLEVMSGYNDKPDKIITVCEDIRNKYFGQFQGLDKWLKEQSVFAEKHGYTDCMIGGRRHLPYLLHPIKQNDNKDKKKKRNNLLNIASNSCVQTFEALMIYKAMTKIHNAYKEQNLKSKMIGMIHDSLVNLAHKSEIETVYHIIKDAMEDYTFFIPLICEMEIGKVLGFGEKLDETNLRNYS